MRAIEMVLAFERYKGKQLSPEQRAEYTRKFQRFNPDQRQRIYDTAIENCRFFPTVADCFEAAKDLGYLEPPRREDRGALGRLDCQICEGTGWQYLDEPTVTGDGNRIDGGQAVRSCQCRKERAAHAA
ncbi:hypothetical protein MYX82_13190 [Acidobacteria bacterium AH-259-D05]|nr:hypothetical protein [Acidobacteria bacterium AH-259-D05]